MKAGLLPIVLSGCSGSGKSSLLAALSRRGYRVSEEVGRIVVREEMRSGGSALPWNDAAAFVEIAVARAVEQYDEAIRSGEPVILDRSVIDLVSFLEYRNMSIGEHLRAAVLRCRCFRTVFVTPPWRAIYSDDGERQKGFGEAVREYETLRRWYRTEGYDMRDIPFGPIEDRAEFVATELRREGIPPSQRPSAGR